MKYILLGLSVLLVVQQSKAFIKVRVPTIKEVVNEGKKTVDNVGKTVGKAVEDAGKVAEEAGKAVGNAAEDVAKGTGQVIGAVIEGTADVAEGALKEGATVVGNVGAEAGRVLTRVGKETKRIGDRAVEDFKNGLPYAARVTACVATLCYSEYKLDQEVKEAKKEYKRRAAKLKAEIDAAIDSKRVEKIKEFIVLLESRKSELLNQNKDFEKIQRLNTSLGVEVTKRFYAAQMLQAAGKQVELLQAIENELLQELVAELNSGAYFNRSVEEVDLLKELIVVSGELGVEVVDIIKQLPLYLSMDALATLADKIMNQKAGFMSLENENALELSDIEEKLAYYKAEIGA